MPFDKSKFTLALKKIRKLTNKSPKIFEPQMKDLCREAGVALVFVPELKKMHISGVSRWISKDKALIILSLRHKKDDHFWFSFFHEAFHILLHGKKEIFVDNIVDNIHMGKNDEEKEADDYASEILIPMKKYREFLEKENFTRINIMTFAKEIDIAPGIIVGRLQHENIIWFNKCTDLKNTFKFKEEN